MVSDGANIWFGIPGRMMQYVPAPQSGFQKNWVTSSQQLRLEDGRQVLKVTPQRYLQFTGDFFGDQREMANIDLFNQFATGFYGTGPIVFADPYAARTNVFSPQWATPSLAERGWSPLTGTSLTIPPSFGSLTGNVYGRPSRYVYYNITTPAYSATSPANQFNQYIAIPPGHTLYLGASGTATGSGAVIVQKFDRSNAPSGTVMLSLIQYNSATQMNQFFDGDTVSAVRVFLSRTTLSTAGLTLYSMMGQIIPNRLRSSSTLSPTHIPGEGHLGLTITGDAIAETYNYNGVRKGLSLTLEEAL